MTLHAIIVALFFVALIANAVTMVRHWRMMRVLRITLDSISRNQTIFNELIEAERKKVAEKNSENVFPIAP